MLQGAGGIKEIALIIKEWLSWYLTADTCDMPPYKGSLMGSVTMGPRGHSRYPPEQHTSMSAEDRAS